MGSAEAWRDTKAGMWAWLLQRVAAVGLLAVIVVHLKNPFERPVQAVLLALVLLLLGGAPGGTPPYFGLPARWHRLLFLLALLTGVVAFALFWYWRWY